MCCSWWNSQDTRAAVQARQGPSASLRFVLDREALTPRQPPPAPSHSQAGCALPGAFFLTVRANLL